MNSLPTYLQLMLIGLAATAFLVILFLLSRRWNTRPTRLRLLLSQRNEDSPGAAELVPLLVYEEKYPAFCEILGLVLERFPLSRFTANSEFAGALSSVTDSACSQTRSIEQRAAMSQIVRTFLQDPDVEYHCRPLLSPLVDRFLGEIGDPGE